MAAIDNHWDESTLWAKAVLYTRLATESDRESWLYPFWSSLALEFTARAALAHVSPTLLADTSSGDAGNLLYALGRAPFSPGLKSIGIAEALSRCERLFADFTVEHRKFCAGFTGRRNEELHTGSSPFGALKSQSWLPRYYEAVQALLTAMGRSMKDLFGSEAAAATKMIAALHDDAARQVKQSISARRTVWQERQEADRLAANQRATSAAQRHLGHVVICPACSSKALVAGEEIDRRDPALEGEEIVERATMLPTELKCEACGLHIVGHAQLHAADLGDTFTQTRRTDAIEYYGQLPDYEPEPDFNE
jgi:hypothetical protein